MADEEAIGVTPVRRAERGAVSVPLPGRSWARRRAGLGYALRVYLPLGLFVTFLLAPYYVMVITAFKPDSELYSTAVSPLLVSRPTLIHFGELFQKTAFFLWAQNSFVVATVSTGLALLLGVPGGYAMARLRFRGSGLIGLAIFATYLVPGTLLFIPMHQIVNALGLLDTPFALIVVYPTFLTPFCAWLMAGYFKTIPGELEDCARIDGCSRFGAMCRITIPLATPGILSCAIFSFTGAWNEFLYALVLVTSGSLKTLPVGIVATLLNTDAYPWGKLMAGALLASIPVAVVYSFFVEHYAAGLTSGAIKG
ncbi:MAG TPA: carbohydrate ABC transporter permease [Chloroflexota bacterium]|jgi:multiple sugar transport system permease protein